MAEVNYRFPHSRPPSFTREVKAKRSSWKREWWFWAFAILVFAEIIMPIILSTARLPRSMDFLKELVAASLIGIALIHMMLRDRIPAAVLILLGASLVWGLISTLDGQSVSSTAWGWWRFFKYPMLMLFAYLVPKWPDNFARWLVKFFVILLAFQVGIQFIQFATGVSPGDHLAGTFGRFGVGELTMLVFFIVCIGMGHWLATDSTRVMFLTLFLGLVSTMLNVSRFYLVAVVIVAIVAFFIFMIRGGKIRRLFTYILLLSFSLAIFFPIYNTFLVESLNIKPLYEVFEPENLQSYLFVDSKVSDTGLYRLGRAASVAYAWQQIQRDAITVLFGYGIGSRTYSTFLGFQGVTLEDDLYGGGGNTGLGVWIQEFGLLGIILFLLINSWIVWKLLQHAGKTSDQYLAVLEYGIVLFTLLWPLWLFYHKAWSHGGMMSFYWLTLGFIANQIYSKKKQPVLNQELTHS
ncbi:MAG: hypothetical protein R6X18_19520 [Chloroflexota bacterium]